MQICRGKLPGKVSFYIFMKCCKLVTVPSCLSLNLTASLFTEQQTYYPSCIRRLCNKLGKVFLNTDNYWCPGVDALLHFIDTQNAAEDSTSSRICPTHLIEDMYSKMCDFLPAHKLAFDRGLISCERLIEVLVHPFLKLSCTYSKQEPSQGRKLGIIERFCLGWGNALGVASNPAHPTWWG